VKVSLILLVSIGLFPLQTTPAYCQSGNDPNLVIERIIETGMIEGHDAKVIGGMGDAAAVILAKVLANRDLRQQDVGGGLWILADAFAGDRCFSFDSDRTPWAAFLLLRYFDLSTTDAEVKNQIAQVRKGIEKNCPASHQIGGKEISD
jgi:hypothetical protein